MKHLLILGIFLFSFQFTALSQSRKRVPDKYSYISTQFNVYPSSNTYSFYRQVFLNQDRLLLTFLTANSGTFVIDDNSPIPVDVERQLRFPTQQIGLGIGWVFEKGKTFHHLSLSRLSAFNSTDLEIFTLVDSSGDKQTIRAGYEQNTFIFGIRYEAGKIFGNRRRSKWRFGLAGAIEPSIFSFKQKVFSPKNFPVKSRIFTTEISVIPMLAIQLSKKVFLDLKIIPNLLIADFGTPTVNNPILSPDAQKGERPYNPPEINWIFSAQVRYQIKEPKKRRRSNN